MGYIVKLFKYIKKKYWTKCALCNKRGFESPAKSYWSGSHKWCKDCDNLIVDPRIE